MTDEDDVKLRKVNLEAHGVMRRKGQVTVPAEIRKAARLEANEPIIFRVTAEGVLLQPGKVVNATQSWFWSERWQRMEREADESFAAGRHTTFDDVDSFLADLDA